MKARAFPRCPSQHRRVVILALDALGDMVLRQPLLAALADQGMEVTVVVRRGVHEILPFLDRRLQAITMDIDPHGPLTNDTWRELAALASAIGQHRPDLIVAAAHNRTYVDEWVVHQFADCASLGFANPLLPPSLLTSRRIAPPSGRIRSPLFTHIVDCAVEAHEIDKYRALAQAIAAADLCGRMPTIALDESVLRDAATAIAALGLAEQQYVIGCPAGTLTVALKAWAPEQYAEVVAHLNDTHGLPVLVVGSQAEAAALGEIADACDRRGVRTPVWTGGPGSLPTLLGLIAHSRLYFGNDTGPMHLAGALGVPVVARLGGGHWPRFLPMAARAFTATQSLPCFGCSWHCQLEEPACMTQIETRTFIDGVNWALQDGGDARRVDYGKPPARVTVRAHPKVLVVTPSLNQGRFLRDTIESVLGQGYPHLDYVVADGGSTDESVEILRSYGPRLRWTSAPDDGQAAVIARAWRESDADIVAWLNSDDTYLPGAIDTAVQYLRAHPETAMVYGQSWLVNETGRAIEPYPTKPFDREALASECFISQPATFLRRAALDVVDPPDPALRYCMDYELWIRLSQHFRIDYLERFLATSRVHSETKSLRERDAMVCEIIAVAQRYFGAVDRKWIFGLAHHRWTRILDGTSIIPAVIQQRCLAALEDRVRGDHPGFLYDDRWAGRRTVLAVESGADGRVTLHCDCIAYACPLAVTVSLDGTVLATQEVREPGAFTIHFVLPADARPKARVLLDASRAFTPVLIGLSSDPRTLSFRVLEATRADAAARPTPSAPSLAPG